QRITRYPLLIQQILQYTDPPTPTLDLSMAPRLTLSLPTERVERESMANSGMCRADIERGERDDTRSGESGEVSQDLRTGKE
ncbi:hypothetical protein PISMIDRAFT_686347, partial [Pisolithus microcarpus 441]